MAAPTRERMPPAGPNTARTDDSPFQFEEFSPRVGPEGRPISEGMIFRAHKQRPRKGQGKKSFLAQITHLHLQNKMINQISHVEICPNLQVLYLYDNQISSTAPLKAAPRLTHLYLQNNRLRCLENLPVSLVKLFLDGNQLCDLSGIQHLVRLQELSLAAQRLPSTEGLSISPDAFESCEGTLVSLNLAGNFLRKIPPSLFSLHHLRRLILSNNKIDSIVDARDLISQLEELEEVDFRGNPIVKDRQYKPALLVASQSDLTMLDGSQVVREHREKLISLALHRQRGQGSRQPHEISPTPPSTSIAGLLTVTPCLKEQTPRSREGEEAQKSEEGKGED